jgi:6-phosphofructokinase 1
MSRRIGVLTSGGDAPGMNAAIRAVTRSAHARGWTTLGIHRGYRGLIEGEMDDLGPRSVSNVIQRGGTFLLTGRSEEFHSDRGLERACRSLEGADVDGLVLIGGDGTFRGGLELGRIWSGQIVGIPGTIDNDLFGTDSTLGFDTALNTALESLDKVRDTAASHERVFLVEVMGRDAGFIALAVGVACGAEEILMPETPTDISGIVDHLNAAAGRGKTSSILVVAEGDEEGGAFQIAQRLSGACRRECRVVVLGHVQRGGAPSARDRLLGTKLGAFAVETLDRGESGVMVGEVKGELVTTPFEDTWTNRKPLDAYLVGLLPVLAL